MLVLSRKTSEVLWIGDQISVMIIRIGPGSVRLGIEAPKSMPIRREELPAKAIEDLRGVSDVTALRKACVAAKALIGSTLVKLPPECSSEVSAVLQNLNFALGNL